MTSTVVHSHTTTTTLPAPRDTDSSTGDPGKFFHYVRKNKIVESVVDGTHVVALCGEVFPVREVPKPGKAVCPECKRIYDRLKR